MVDRTVVFPDIKNADIENVTRLNQGCFGSIFKGFYKPFGYRKVRQRERERERAMLSVPCKKCLVERYQLFFIVNSIKQGNFTQTLR